MLFVLCSLGPHEKELTPQWSK